MKRYDTVEPLAGLVEDRSGEWVRFEDIPAPMFTPDQVAAIEHAGEHMAANCLGGDEAVMWDTLAKRARTLAKGAS